jgi:transmembrane sensor
LSVLGIAIWGTSEPAVSHHVPVHTYTTNGGQQATVTLADGSRALLGPATTLSVAMQPSDASLDVHVVGQALFTVIHHQRRSLRVHTDNAVVRVLGTTFMVRHYGTEPLTRVVVTEGRVSLSGVRADRATGSSQVLIASTLGTVNDSGQVEVVPHVAVDEYTGWATGKLVFRDTPARDAVIELGRAYGVDIRITDSTLAKRPLSWTVALSQRSLADVLEPLSAVLGAHPVRAGRLILLVPGRAASPRPVGPSPLLSSETQYGK